MKYAPLNYASIGGTPETIGATGESVEKFEIMSFFETRNNFLLILHKKDYLHELCAIKLRMEGW